MLDFYLWFMLRLEKPAIQKHYYIVHNQVVPILDLMRIDEGNTREKITQWGVRNLRSTNGLENILAFQYNEQNHQSIFLLEHNSTLHFNFIFGYHNTWKANQFVKCAMFEWSYAKGILHNLMNGWLLTLSQLYMSHCPHKMEHGNVDTQLQNILISTWTSMAIGNTFLVWK